MQYYQEYTSPIGEIRVAEEEGAIIALELGGTPGSRRFLRRGELTYEQSGKRWMAAGAERRETPVIAQAHRELEEYFTGKRQVFSVPLSVSGTPFQERVWEALRTIPYGETRTYGQIAVQIGRPTASRAVGMANHRNPIAILIPCHRVIGADGTLTGYGGGLDVKEFLLEWERSHKDENHLETDGETEGAGGLVC